MAPFFTRLVSKIYRRIVAEIIIEIPLILEKWKFIVFGVFWQYLHGVAARIAHYLHQPGPILHDVGFDLLPTFNSFTSDSDSDVVKVGEKLEELGPEKAWISEIVFTFIFTSFVLWTFHPFVFQNKRFYTVYLWYRVLAMLVIAQALRVISFLVTQLPGPNYHCREGSPAATLPSPKYITDILLLNFPYGVIYGCGDLIFSSHMTFAITFVHAYARYGTSKWVKRAAWLLVIIQSLLIIASRKHYTVDVVVAWYVVILLFNYVGRKFYDPELMDRTAPNDQILPWRNGRNKEDYSKFTTNGHSGADHWDVGRQRNGKILDDGFSVTIA